MMRMGKVWLSLVFCFLAATTLASAQATTSTISGTVTDTQKAAIPAATVTVINAGTGTKVTAKTDVHGYWAVPSLQAGNYEITVSQTGFTTADVKNVKLDTGVPAQVPVSLAVGAVTQTVEVTGGAEVLQTSSATVSNTIEADQIAELPFTSRNVTELIATQPGTESSGGIRYSLIDNLPQSSINQTLDGINIQDNGAKSTDGVFVAVQPRMDAVQEVTVSSADSGADSLGQGAVQMKFVTKSGTNQWHGDAFEQNRNQALESNYFFNKATGLPRDFLNLNDYGGSIGGPIMKNKLFVFVTMDAFRLPQSILENGQMWLTPTASTGVFTYKETNGTVNTVNLYTLAATEDTATNNKPAGGRAFPTQADPELAAMESEIQSLVSASGIAQVSRVASNNDYNRYNFGWSPRAQNNRNFPSGRLDYDINAKNRLSFISNWQSNNRLPDAVNTTEAILPGTGSTLGSPITAGQIDDFWTQVAQLRTTLSPNLTNEMHFGMVGGADWFDGPMAGATAPLNNYWYGTIPSMGGYITNPYRVTPDSPSKRDDPVTQFNDTVSWVKGNHLPTFGFDFSSISEYSWANGSQNYAQPTIGVSSTDPVASGSTNLFTSANFPGSSSTQLTDAESLYALLTGRLSSISTQAALDPTSNTYGNGQTQSYLRQREWALYAQDNWKLTPRFSLNYGLRFDKQQPMQDVLGVFTTPGYAGLFGVSGVGNLFMPGTLTGTTPQFNAEPKGAYTYDHSYKFDPSLGFAYQLPDWGGVMTSILGHGAVVRGGYAIADIREGTSSVLSSNPGRTISTAVSASANPTVFLPGQVSLSDFGGNTGFAVPTLAPTSVDATYPTPSYPIAVTGTQSLNAYDPNLKMEYVQSWDFGLQRQFGPNTDVEIRYVGNHGTDLFRAENLNEVNILGAATGGSFLSQFQQAQANLANNRSVTSTPTSNDFTNDHAGDSPIPILTAAGVPQSSTTTNQLLFGSAGAMASGIATNAAEMTKLATAGYPVNLFTVNPTTTGASNLTTNGGSSTYNSLQIEVRRRLSSGLTLGGSYVYSKGLTNTGNGEMTLRDPGLDKGLSPEDIRNSFKANWLWDLPVGPGHAFLGHSDGRIAKTVFSGWSYDGVMRVQSGAPSELMSGTGFATFDQGDPGVVLHNIDAKQLQSMMKPYVSGAPPSELVYYLPQTLISNTLAAYGVSGTLNAGQPYIGPPTAGQLGDRIYLYGPWLSLFDMSLVKHTQLTERFNLELRVQADNVFNTINFELPGAGTSAGQQSITASATSFGQTTNSFRDFSNTNDPGSRTLDLYVILHF